MRKYHELTEKMRCLVSLTDIDRIVRAWLEEKTHRLAGSEGDTYRGIRSTLGLTEPEKEQNVGVQFVAVENFKIQEKGDSVNTDWPCGHIREYRCEGKNPKDEWYCDGFGYVNGQPHFCITCGLPRPEKKGPEEELSQVLKEAYAEEVGCSVENLNKKGFLAEARAALRLFRERMEKEMRNKFENCYQEDVFNAALDRVCGPR